MCAGDLPAPRGAVAGDAVAHVGRALDEVAAARAGHACRCRPLTSTPPTRPPSWPRRRPAGRRPPGADPAPGCRGRRRTRPRGRSACSAARPRHGDGRVGARRRRSRRPGSAGGWPARPCRNDRSTPRRQARRAARPPGGGAAWSGRAQPHRHRVGGGPAAGGDLGGGQLVDVPADQRLPGLGGQHPERPVEQLDQLITLEQVDQRVVQVVGVVRVSGPDVAVEPLESCPSRPVDPVSSADVACDRVEPGRRAARVDEPVAQTPGRRQRLLREVLGSAGIAGQARAEAGEPTKLVRARPGHGAFACQVHTP